MTARQKLDARMNELSHVAKKSLGQNFLISDAVIEKILNQSKKFLSVGPKGIIEIGPGLGALTDSLAEMSKNYLAIEFDRGLAEYWKNKDLKVEHIDAMKYQWETAPFSLLVSNLPYQISATLVVELSTTENPITHMVLMFQKEVAERIRADEKSDHYGFLSVLAQMFWTVEKVCDASPRDFLPSPKIASRVLSFVRKTDSGIENPMDFLRFLKSLFQQRRRQLQSVLRADFSVSDRQLLLDFIKENGYSETVRTEELSPKMIQKMYLAYKTVNGRES